MSSHQVGILAPGPSLGRFLFFQLAPGDDPRAAVKAIQELDADEDLVVGLGNSLVLATGSSIDGLRAFPSLTGPGIEVPSTQTAVWCWLRGAGDRGQLVHRSLELEHLLEPLALSSVVDGFKHDPTPSGRGRDLSGYEDGTENPTGDKAIAAAIVSGRGAGLDGSSFVAVQTWQHDLVGFQAMTQDERDNIIGRRRSDNEEIEDAPDSAHVKRTAQESFEPEAFVVRQSMPWADPDGGGPRLRFLRADTGRVRGATHADGWPRRRHRRWSVPLLPSGIRGVLLVPSGAGGKARPPRTDEQTVGGQAMGYRVVDSYYRQPLFDLFRKFQLPIYSVTVELDITGLRGFHSQARAADMNVCHS